MRSGIATRQAEGVRYRVSSFLLPPGSQRSEQVSSCGRPGFPCGRWFLCARSLIIRHQTRIMGIMVTELWWQLTHPWEDIN